MYATNEIMRGSYLLVERFNEKQPMTRLYKQEIEGITFVARGFLMRLKEENNKAQKGSIKSKSLLKWIKPY